MSKKELDTLQAALDEASQALESFIEEQSGEEGGLVEAMNDKEKVTAASVKARIKLAATDKGGAGCAQAGAAAVRRRDPRQEGSTRRPATPSIKRCLLTTPSCRITKLKLAGRRQVAGESECSAGSRD